MSTRTSAPAPHTEYFPAPASRGIASRWVGVIVDDAVQLRRFWPVVQNMVGQDLRVRYQRSMLGFFWTLVNPILMMATLTFVFSKMIPHSGDGDFKTYAIYLFAGLVPWGFLSQGLSDCAFCIIQNEGLIRKIFLPKLVFPITRVLIALTTFLLSLTALYLMLIPLGARPSLPMVLLPVIIVLFTCFTLGLGLIVATMNTFYRDCGHLVSVFLQAWYFASPILYKLDDYNGPRRWMLLNPALPFLDVFHAIISDGRWPALTSFLGAAGIASVSLGVGYAVFKSYEHKFVFRL